ncbi:subunit of exocyst complex 8 [Actinidia rufa]|uniref:Exocyst complex component Sec8 n=2 Tax=Magnoliopsida TaxID=3398 RepID=A0A7J0GV21_9ERIC|nr:subunit of exocyst complex 8 [Actinidia rufa]
MGILDGLPISREKAYLREELERIDESWSAARFDSLPHVVHILTSKDREGEVQILKEQSDVVEEVVDEVVHAYHSGFNKAIQNYSQDHSGRELEDFPNCNKFSSVLLLIWPDAKKLLGARSKQLHQLWYRSVTLRHIISLLDQLEGIAKVPGRIEKLITEKQFYAAVQLHVQSTLMLEREGLQTVGALQDIRSELTKLRGVLFYKVLEDLHAHLYNRGEYSIVSSSINESDDEVPTTTVVAFSLNNSQPLSRRTRSVKCDSQIGAGDGYRPNSVDGGSSFDGHDEDGAPGTLDEAISDGHTAIIRVNGGDSTLKDVKVVARQIPAWLSYSTPDEFVEAMRKSDAALHVKYSQTMVECLCMLGKVAAAGAIICQRLRPTIHDIITMKIKAHAEHVNCSRPGIGQGAQTAMTGLLYIKGHLESYQLSKQKRQNGISMPGMLLAVSPVSTVMAPMGTAQAVAKDILNSILDTVVRIFENHVIVGELLESKSSQQVHMNTPKSMAEINWNPDTEVSRDTGGYSIGFTLTVMQSECQQLICEILRATPEAASADAAVQTARLANKAPSKEKRPVKVLDRRFEVKSFVWLCKRIGACRFLRMTSGLLELLSRLNAAYEKISTIQLGADKSLLIIRRMTFLLFCDCRDGSEDGLTFAFRFTDATISIPNQGVDVIRQGWSRRGPNVLQEGYGTAAVLPEQGIYLAASVYRPVLQFTEKVASMLPHKYSQLGNDGLLAFVENFVKDHFLPTMFVDYRKGVQQAISSPAAFRPRAHAAATYTPLIEKGRPVLQGLLAIDFLAKEVLGWAQAMPKFAGALVNVMHFNPKKSSIKGQAVLEKQSYMLIGRHDVENLMRLDPASACLPNSLGQPNTENNVSDAETVEFELEMSELLLNLRPIKQENLIRDDNKLILLASLSDSLELGKTCARAANQAEENSNKKTSHHARTSSAPPKDLTSFAEEYRKLAIDCLKVLRVEMQLETIFHMQEMTSREYLEDQDAEEPDDFIISLTSQITRRDEEMSPFVEGVKRNYIFGGICSVAANASIKALADMKSINLFGVQQICRNSIALEQALAAISSIDSEALQLRLDRVRTYYELLNMPFEALLAFIMEHEHLFTAAEYGSLLKVQVPGREIPPDAQTRVTEILSH